MTHISRLAFIVIATFCTGATAIACFRNETRVILIGQGTFKMTIPASWRLELRSGFESETYTVSDRDESLFFIYRGNNPDVEEIGRDRQARVTMLNSNYGTEFSTGNRLTDVVLTPRCGPDKYVWIRIRLFDRQKSKAITRAIAAFDCAH
jgi:hypothetical protein